ncbi:acetyl-CoA synthetase-like protein [Dendrothele bispora CBS 962.96]|uniref:Acetyl-CoA synthetase-like protein n=1 Tax=Dendrothele bispora (strain CBS 962.96) TaxID=1314807 RepID=A0A4S8M4S3_DENBC|nr:acetyl-CoA synthetase-like protein [Dendrothele bispora CBS 962.96]
MSSATATASDMTATLALPPLPHAQAVSPSNTTFAAPPLHDSISVLQMLDWHYDHSSSHPFFIYAQPDVPSSSESNAVRIITWKETVEAVYTGVELIRNHVQRGLGPNKIDGQVVGILSYSDSIPYATTMLSVMRANLVLFPISPRNSPQAVAHLVQKVGVAHMLVVLDQSVQELMSGAVEFLKAEYGYRDDQIPAASMMPLFEDLYLENGTKGKIIVEKIREETPLKRQRPQDIQFYLHSSGSTAFPKPIPYTTRGYLELSVSPYFAGQDLKAGNISSMHAVPMFHSMGMFHLAWVITCGIVCAVFPPQLPPVQPTPENVFHASVETNVDYTLCVPSLIEVWSQTPSYVDWLAKRKGVIFGGGPLDKEVGDRLAAKGVPLFSAYGSTECGSVSQHTPKEVDRDAWDYLRFNKHLNIQFIPSGDDAFELVMLSNEHFTPRVFNTTINGVNGYATADLFIEHPQKKGYWKILGRVDSQIIHSSGEKTNPGPLESIMNRDPHVTASVMFGRGKFQAGIIVEPTKEEQFDPRDDVKLSEFRNKIWPTVEKMNAFAPQHSRIFKEMILVASPSKPFTYTAKNTTRNNAIIKEYASEIEAIYDSLEESTQSNIPAPAQWDLESSTEFVRTVVKKVLAIEDIGDEEDVFQRGGDSLQATWIKNSLLRGLRDSNNSKAKVDTRGSTSNFVYEHPTIASLASFITLVAQRGTLSPLQGSSEMQAVERDVEAMHRMVEKYSKNFVPVNENLPLTSNERKVVLMTGSTGSVGVHILDRLLQDETVERVYALIRKGGSGLSIEMKQVNGFIERGVDSDLVRSKKLVLLEASLSQERFGLEEGVFEEVKSRVTHIIANAWRVDFNIGLSSFEADIKGLRYMVDLALAKNALLVFISSIGVFQRYIYAKTRPFSEQHLPAQVASSGGYSQGKWVSEQIMQNAATQARLRSVIVRLGQACGSPNGSWNSKEWLPALVRSAPVLGCVPGDDRLVSWIPADMAARAIKDFLDVPTTETNGQTAIVHLIHPRPVRWSTLAHLIASRLENVDVVPFKVWLAKLEEKGREDPEAEKKISALRILEFYKGLASETQARSGSVPLTTSGQTEDELEAFGFPEIGMERAKKLSETLADPEVRQLEERDVERWLRCWGLLRD